ncbi:MAG: ABC transporter permease [Thaumarchaeota archaeon]|nr:ABC transporter permease [Nitrososphaerota archaeon]
MTDAPPTETPPAAGAMADFRLGVYLLRRNKLVLAGTVLAVASLAIALLSNIIVNPNAWKTTDLGLRLCWNNPAINWQIENVFNCQGAVHAFGTDAYGRDLLQMIILALPLDLQVSLEVVASAIVIGVVFGSVAAYAGGVVDEAILRITDVFFAVPGILLAIVIMAILGRTIANLTFAVLITWWPLYVRLIRSQVLSEKEKPYVEALRAMGASRPRILFRHIVPNSIFPVIVQATLDIGSVILTFATLVFLGFTPSATIPELGNLANQGIQYIFTAPWLILFPGLTILLVSLGFNLLGDGLRDIFDPRLRR